ncbi:MAG TPA: hypothetical protein VF886_12130 [Roseiarcus sp.]
MRTSLWVRAVCGSAAVMLFLSLGFEAALARGSASFGAPAMRPGGHAFAPGSRHGGFFPGLHGGSRSDRFSRNDRFRNRFGLFGGGFWYSPYAFADVGGGDDDQVIIVTAHSLNEFPAAITESADPPSQGGCVIHKLNYDSAGKYVGERQIPGC